MKQPEQLPVAGHRPGLNPAGWMLLAAVCFVPSATSVGAPVSKAIFDERLPQAPLPVKLFQAYGGQWSVQAGELRTRGEAGPKLISEAADFTTGAVGVELLLPDKRSGNAGLIVRVSEPGIGADAFVGYEIALDAEHQVLRLGKHRHNFTLLRDVPCAVPVNQWIPLEVRLDKSTLEILVDGKTLVRHEDSSQPLPGGAVGLRPWQREARFRNFWVQTGGPISRLAFESGASGRVAPLEEVRVPPIAFITRHPLSRPNTISCDLWQSRPRQWGCSIRLYDPSKPGRPAKTIFADPEGCIYDMNISADARTLYFSYRPKDDPHWHLYRIHTDGSQLQQLTDGPHYDISPMPLPGGDLIFVSTRRGGYTLCQPGPASNLHRWSADGGGIQCISMNTLADFSPQMLPDGRVLFTRWEYIDRDLTYRQSLWTQNPDGTGYQLFFGNTIRDVGTFWQARPLPGRTDRVVTTLAPHHGWPHGAIGLITTRFGLEARRGDGFVYLTKEFPHIGDQSFEWSYRDPFPLSETHFLVSYGGEVNRQRLYLLDTLDHKRLLYEDPDIGCYNPLPLVPCPTPAALVEQHSRSAQPWGTFLLADVYQGLPGIERGRIKSLRVMEQVRKTEDLVNRAYDQSPVMSYATYYAKRTWGTVPVEPDGSAYFRAPALREIYFQVLDAEGREVQRMTSGAQLMPGQTMSCIGCHEPREQAPPAAARQVPRAAMGPPKDLRLPDYVQDGMVDFPTVVQPVLDAHCVRCHGGTNPDGGLLLTGDKTRLFNMAYDNLLGRSRSYRQHNMLTGEMLPEEQARPKPLVHFYWLLRTPSAVNQPLWTGSHASRLPDYLTEEHCQAPVPPEDRRRIYLWIDANVPYYATYAHARPQSPGRRDLCTDVGTGRESAWFAKDFMGIYQRRCQSCHDKYPHPNDHGVIWDGRLAWINFTHPEQSPALTAHLTHAAGGRGIGTPANGNVPPVFTDTHDPDYRTMLQAIREGRRLMQADPPADLPGFKLARKEP